MSRSRIRSKQHIQKRRQARLRRIKFYAAGVVTVMALLVGLTHVNALQISDVTVVTESDVTDAAVLEQAQDALSRRWLGIVARDNIILLPRNEIRESVHLVSSRIDTVEVSSSGLRGIEVAVTNRDPVARACGTEVSAGDTDTEQETTNATSSDSESIVNPSGCYLVDADGLLFSLSDQDEIDDLLTYRIHTPLRAGTNLLPSDSFHSILAFVRALDDIRLDPQEVEIQEGGDLVIPVTDATAATSSGQVDLYISIYKDLVQTAANLQTVIQNRSFVAEEETNEGPADPISPFSLEYIDMRFNNKVFYK